MERIQGAPYGEQPDVVKSSRNSGDTPALLVSARTAASLCSKSLRTWRTWDSQGLIPRPVRIGRSTLWRADELREWIAAGCPGREQWEAQR